MLMNEISELRNRLDAARQEASTATRKHQEADQRTLQAEARATEMERRVKLAEARAREAETAIHDLAGKIAVEGITANRKISELEAKVAELNNRISSILSEYRTEQEAHEQRASLIRARISHWSG